MRRGEKVAEPYSAPKPKTKVRGYPCDVEHLHTGAKISISRPKHVATPLLDEGKELPFGSIKRPPWIDTGGEGERDQDAQSTS